MRAALPAVVAVIASGCAAARPEPTPAAAGPQLRCAGELPPETLREMLAQGGGVGAHGFQAMGSARPVPDDAGRLDPERRAMEHRNLARAAAAEQMRAILGTAVSSTQKEFTENPEGQPTGDPEGFLAACRRANAMVPAYVARATWAGECSAPDRDTLCAIAVLPATVLAEIIERAEFPAGYRAWMARKVERTLEDFRIETRP